MDLIETGLQQKKIPPLKRWKGNMEPVFQLLNQMGFEVTFIWVFSAFSTGSVRVQFVPVRSWNIESPETGDFPSRRKRC